jgi:formamidopyrimidine-DNA glycosylase
MPELPEVETVLRALLGSGIKGASISRIEIKKQSHIKEISPENFVKELIGKAIKNIERKGK